MNFTAASLVYSFVSFNFLVGMLHSTSEDWIEGTRRSSDVTWRTLTSFIVPFTECTLRWIVRSFFERSEGL